MPTISVIMSVHNAGRFLAPAVESILNQTFRDLDFIIIDDGSTDASRELLERFAKRDQRVKLICQENQGLTASLNCAIALAKSDLLARMDADDLALPDRLGIQVRYMQQHPEVVLLGGAYELIDEAGRALTILTPPQDDATLQEHCLSGRTPICHPLAMMRSDAVRNVGGYDPQLTVAQDLDLWLKLGEIGKLACVSDVLLRYRQHEHSVSEKKQRLQVQNMKLACERAYQRRGIQREFLGEGGWRPSSQRSSRHEFALRYGWWAFNNAHRRTAAIYGLKAISALPWDSRGWKLLVCAALKPVKVSRADA